MTAQPTPLHPLPKLISQQIADGVQVLQGLARATVQGQAGQNNTADAWAAAMEALRRASSPDAFVPVGDVPGLHVYVSSDELASSRALVLPHLLGALPVAGAFVSVPAADQLLVLRLDAMAHLDSLPVLLNAHRIAVRSAAEPLISNLLWTDGTHWEAVETTQGPDGAHITPGPALRLALTRLASLGWSPAQAALG